MSEIIYVGKGKESQYGTKINLCLDDMMVYADKNIDPAKNGKKYIRLDVNKMRQVDERGNTHTVKVDTWKPKQEANQAPADKESVPF